MKLIQLQQLFINELSATLYDTEESNQIFLWLLKEYSGLSKSQFIFNKNDELDDALLSKYKEILNELKCGKPVQYIMGKVDFYGLGLFVNSSVLIPRPETEELVDWVAKEVMSSGLKIPFNILDIGTGSGCIALALKKLISNASVTAVDFVNDSLQTAIQNAHFNQLEIEFILEDILQINHIQDRTFDVIVSNPPYITQSESSTMHQNVLNFEPHRALFVDDDDPLLFYRAIANYAANNLNDNGSIFFEINEAFGEETLVMLKDKGFNHCVLKKDMQGKDRMILAKKKI